MYMYADSNTDFTPSIFQKSITYTHFKNKFQNYYFSFFFDNPYLKNKHKFPAHFLF